MKRGTFLLIILISILLVSFIKADSFTIVWGSTTQQGELTIGGSDINTPISAGGSTGTTQQSSQPPSGGGGTITPAGLGLDKSLLTIKIKKGEQTEQKVVITNNLLTNLTIGISVTNLSNFIFPSENKITLKPGESKNIIFDIYVSENVKENMLVGQIVFQSSDATSKYVNVILDLSEKAPLFDIKTTILKKMLFKGQAAIANVKVLNLGDLKNIDVQLESRITDSRSNIYDSTKESFAINDSSTKKVSLQVPRNIPLGNYIFFSKVSYGNISATSYDSFQIIQGIVELGTAVFYIATAIIFTLIALVSTLLIRRVKND